MKTSPRGCFGFVALRWVSMCLILLAPCAWAADAPSRPPEAAPVAVDPALAAVVKELRAYSELRADERAAFRPEAASPENLQRLLAAPDFAQRLFRERWAAVQLAARLDTVLVAERPSDIARQMARWFPWNTALVQRERRLRGLVDASLQPDETWSTRSIVFFALWSCLPQRVWIWADGLPSDDHYVQTAAWPLGANGSAPQESEFGHCVRRRMADRPSRDAREMEAHRRQSEAVAARATPALEAEFARWLAADRCTARGADDCVTIAAAWASLSPASPALAEALQRLDPEVAPDAPLPPAQREYVDHPSSKFEDARERYQAGLRRAQWLRAQLQSVAHAPQAWPADALARTLVRISRLREDFLDPYVSRWNLEIDYHNEPVSPWRGFDALPDQPRLRAAVRTEVARLDDDPNRPCAVLRGWFANLPPSLQTRHMLERLKSGRESRCAQPEWVWMQKHPSDPEVLALRADLARILGSLQGTSYDELVAGLTEHGDACFGKTVRPRDPSTEAVCRTAVGAPQAVRGSSTVRLTRAERFAPARRPASRSARAEPEDLVRALRLIVDALRPGQGDALQAVLDTLAAQRLQIDGVSGWRSPRGGRGLVELRLSPPSYDVARPWWPWLGDRVLLLVGPEGVRPVGIPGRFGFQYDSGRISAVSDLDRDGHYEVWISGTFGECDGEGARPGIDCSIGVVHMGEIRGDALSWFVRGPGPGATKAR
jgi:hypothetical protein